MRFKIGDVIRSIDSNTPATRIELTTHGGVLLSIRKEDSGSSLKVGKLFAHITPSYMSEKSYWVLDDEYIVSQVLDKYL